MPQQRNKREASNAKHLEKMLAWHFARIGLLGFIRSQRVSVWWNGEDRNNKLSIAFRDFILSLIDGKYDDAVRHRKEIADNCTPWLLCCKSFMRLAYVEYAYFCEATGKRMMDSSAILTTLGISKRKSKVFFDSIHKRLCKSKIAAKTYSAFLGFKDAEASYYNLPIRNCAVCATMGAGKSTFINALLEATTAKITSVYDKDGETCIKGVALTENGRIGWESSDVTLQQLNAINDNKNSVRVFLQGDFDGISNTSFIAAIHDTPGTNNSLDSSHHNVTMQFLVQNRIELVIFILNAEHPQTTDEKALLEELLQSVVRPHRIQVLFVLNKSDSIDPQKESLGRALDKYREYLRAIGYDNPSILPTASKLARLIKMSLWQKNAGKIDCALTHALTDDENDFLQLQMRRFIDNPLKHCTDYALFLLPQTWSSLKGRIDKANAENQRETLALLYTGIPSVEMAIAEYLMVYKSNNFIHKRRVTL